MCYSVQSSLLSYTLGMIAAVYALMTHQTLLGMLILTYSQIQLSEALIWTGLDTQNKCLNTLGTKYGKYMLPAHNIGIALGILMIAQHPWTLRDYGPLMVSVVFYGCVVYRYHQTRSVQETYPYTLCVKRSCQNDQNRLQWPFPTEWYVVSFVISLIFLMVYIDSMASKLFLGTFFVLTFFSAHYAFKKTQPSVWCFSSAILAPFLVFINSFLC